jgi:hypothetical protein
MCFRRLPAVAARARASLTAAIVVVRMPPEIADMTVHLFAVAQGDAAAAMGTKRLPGASAIATTGWQASGCLAIFMGRGISRMEFILSQKRPLCPPVIHVNEVTRQSHRDTETGGFRWRMQPVIHLLKGGLESWATDFYFRRDSVAS